LPKASAVLLKQDSHRVSRAFPALVRRDCAEPCRAIFIRPASGTGL